MKADQKKQSKFSNKIYYSSEGIKNSFLLDISIRWAYYISIPLSITFFVLSPTIESKILSLLVFLLWLVFEHVNTALEATVDRISLKYHELSKLAKDVMAGVIGIVVGFMLISIVLLSLNIKFAYDNYNGSFNDFIKDSFKK